ncbi:MAG: hypothetical protein CMJ39_09540 [Phycisphaerae bacterium]|nr:hypothetical protein [Phycisphaerae bacterium]
MIAQFFILILFGQVLALDIKPVSGEAADSLRAVVQDDRPEPRQRLAEYITNMGSSEWLVRESGTMDLARDRQVTEQMLVTRLTRSGLSQEQRLRILRAIEIRLLRLPRGALGIRMRTELARFRDQEGLPVTGIEIIELLPGMPAEEQLRVGDIIVSIAGEPIDEPTDVSALIKQHWPGEFLELVVARDEPADEAGAPRKSSRLEFKIKLASTSQLENQQQGRRGWNDEQKVLEQQVRNYYQRFAPTARLLLPPDMSPEIPQLSDLSAGYDPTVILQQLVNDLERMRSGLPGALTQVELKAKWSAYAEEIDQLIKLDQLDHESKLMLERLKSQVMELAGLRP